MLASQVLKKNIQSAKGKVEVHTYNPVDDDKGLAQRRVEAIKAKFKGRHSDFDISRIEFKGEAGHESGDTSINISATK